MNGLFLTLSFLTTLPIVPSRYQYEVRHWRTAVFWFPIIGGLIGGLVWLVGWASGLIFGAWLSAVLAVSAWAVATGGLHLDGLADCFDGLLVMAERERRLEIMRDPRLGAFGAIGLILFLLVKISAVQAVLANERGLALVAAAVTGRAMISWVARQPAARSDGLGLVFSVQIRPFFLIIATLPPIGLLILMGWRGGLALALTLIVVAGIIAFARRRIGGVTGDVFGLTVELVELAVLIAFSTVSL